MDTNHSFEIERRGRVRFNIEWQVGVSGAFSMWHTQSPLLSCVPFSYRFLCPALPPFFFFGKTSVVRVSIMRRTRFSENTRFEWEFRVSPCVRPSSRTTNSRNSVAVDGNSFARYRLADRWLCTPFDWNIFDIRRTWHPVYKGTRSILIIASIYLPGPCSSEISSWAITGSFRLDSGTRAFQIS